MPTRNILTPRERHVLKLLHTAYTVTLADPHLDMASQKGVCELIAVLEQVIDSATLPYEEWSTKYLAADAAKWNGEITDA